MLIRIAGRTTIRHAQRDLKFFRLARHNSSSTASSAAAAAGPAAASAELEVKTLLEQVDKSSLLASRFYPPTLQKHFLAIRAFNAEVARVADSVENELMARIRVAWWRDAIVSTFNGKAPRHPIMLAVADAVHDPVVQRYGGLVQEHFVSICDAREADLSAAPGAPSLDAVERYAEKTSSRLFYLSLNLLGVSQSKVDEVFSHLGKARGITQLLASVPFHAGVIRTSAPLPSANAQQQGSAPSEGPKRASRGPPRPRQRRLILPREYLAAHGVVEEEVYRKGAQAKGLRDAVFDTATRANDYVLSARSALKEVSAGAKLPDALIGPLVEATTATTFLQELEKRDFDIFDTKLLLVASGRGWRLPWNMWKVGNRWSQV